jgi:hypothetical protein
MWPWEHLAVGYLCYSLLVRARGERPGGREALAVAVGSQFPDLVDKPLGWVVGVTSTTGLTPTHSLFVAVPLSALVVLVGRWQGAGRVGLAFAVGYLSHLSADALYPVLLGEGLFTWFLFWPLTPVPTHGTAPPLATVRSLAETFVTFLGTPRGTLYVLGELALLAGAVLLWLRDGVPGLPVGRPA